MSDSVIWEIMRESLQLFTVLLIDFTSSEEPSHLARGTLTEPPRPASELKLTALQAHGYVKTPLPCPAPCFGSLGRCECENNDTQYTFGFGVESIDYMSCPLGKSFFGILAFRLAVVLVTTQAISASLDIFTPQC